MIHLLRIKNEAQLIHHSFRNRAGMADIPEDIHFCSEDSENWNFQKFQKLPRNRSNQHKSQVSSQESHWISVNCQDRYFLQEMSIRILDKFVINLDQTYTIAIDNMVKTAKFIENPRTNVDFDCEIIATI